MNAISKNVCEYPDIIITIFLKLQLPQNSTNFTFNAFYNVENKFTDFLTKCLFREAFAKNVLQV